MTRHSRIRERARALRTYWRQFSPNARRFLVATFFIWVQFYAPQVLLALYLRGIGLSEGEIGIVLGARTVGTAAMFLPVAYLAKYVPVRTILMTGVTLYVLFALGLLVAHLPAVLAALSALSGAAFSLVTVSQAPLLTRESVPDHRQRLFSLSFAITTSAGLVTAGLSGLLAQSLGGVLGSATQGLRATLTIAALTPLLGLAALVRVTNEGSPGPKEEATGSSRSRWGFLAQIATVNALIGAGAGLIMPFMSLYFRDRIGLSASAIGFAFFCVQGTTVTSSLISDMATTRHGLVRTVCVTQLLSTPLLLILADTRLALIAVPVFMFRGALMNAAVPVLSNLQMALARPSERHFVNATGNVAWHLAWAASSTCAGLVIERYGYPATFGATALLYVSAAISIYAFFSGKETRRQGPKPAWLVEND